MKLEEIFKLSEDGSLTYEQFAKLVEDNKAKFVDLGEGNYVSQSKFDDAQAKAKSKYDDMVAKHTDELKLRDTRINELDSTLTQKNTDLEDLQAKLADAGQDEAKLNELKDSLSSLQTKYDESQAKHTKEMEDYQNKLRSQAYSFEVKEYANTLDFTSKAAKKNFIREMEAKKLQMEDGHILGADDFMKIYKAENEDSFKQPEPPKQPEPTPEPEPDPEPKPKFVTKTPGTGDDNDSNQNKFSFNFTGVRKH